MTRGTERVVGGATGRSRGGLGYPCPRTVARAARSPRGRQGPEQHERDHHLRRRMAHRGVRQRRPGEIERDPRVGPLLEAGETRREDVFKSADKISEAVIQFGGLELSDSGIPQETVSKVADALGRAFDKHTGGLISGHTNKFPPSMAMALMLREYLHSIRAGSASARSSSQPADADRSAGSGPPTSAPSSRPKQSLLDAVEQHHHHGAADDGVVEDLRHVEADGLRGQVGRILGIVEQPGALAIAPPRPQA